MRVSILEEISFWAPITRKYGAGLPPQLRPEERSYFHRFTQRPICYETCTLNYLLSGRLDIDDRIASFIESNPLLDKVKFIELPLQGS